MSQDLIHQAGASAALAAGADLVALIDPRPLRLAFMRTFLAPRISGRLVCALSPETAAEAARGLAESGPSLVILSIGGESVLAEPVAGQIADIRSAFPTAPLLIISDREQRAEILAALKAGAQGFIPTTTSETVILAMIALVQAGGVYAPAHVLIDAQWKGGDGETPDPKSQTQDPSQEAALIDLDAEDGIESDEAPAGGMHVDGVLLSPRQCEVLSHLRLGLQNKQIAYRLNMRESTVKVHVRAIMRKLAVTNRTQAAFRAQRLPLPPPAV